MLEFIVGWFFRAMQADLWRNKDCCLKSDEFRSGKYPIARSMDPKSIATDRSFGVAVTDFKLIFGASFATRSNSFGRNSSSHISERLNVNAPDSDMGSKPARDKMSNRIVFRTDATASLSADARAVGCIKPSTRTNNSSPRAIRNFAKPVLIVG